MTRFQNTRQPDWDWWGELWPDPVGLLEKVGVAKRDTLADVGCGNGYFTIPAATMLEGQLFAIDLDESLLSQLRAELDERAIDNVTCVCCDARSLSDHIPPVDVAFMANTFHGVEDQTEFAAEVRRTLTSEGRFIVVNWHDLPQSETVVAGKTRGPPETLRLTPEATRERVVPAGFELVSERELPPYHYALVFERTEKS
ncbi:class I SAM-dependent methyltransferase [Haladaptatus sp. DJG-WS-42]|uniref:class I SAM-dependent methyltransferase n=1 Tax=Haladaptatus sp. DJG-WS-42 TaxID=3120516 RepID=UPI0030D0AE66